MFDFGLGGVGATLAARILNYPLLKFYLTNVVVGDDCVVWLDPANSPIPGAYYYYEFPRFEEHFPYGWTVPADVPM